MYSILFVCTGNTCRSPMAEAIFIEKIKKENMKINVSSAGLCVFSSTSISAGSLDALQKKGIQLDGFKSRQLTKELLDDADIVLTMTQDHKNHILYVYPEFSDKVFTLGEFSEMKIDVTDPFGCDNDTYFICAESIECLIDNTIEKIKKIIGGGNETSNR